MNFRELSIVPSFTCIHPRAQFPDLELWQNHRRDHGIPPPPGAAYRLGSWDPGTVVGVVVESTTQLHVLPEQKALVLASQKLSVDGLPYYRGRESLLSSSPSRMVSNRSTDKKKTKPCPFPQILDAGITRV